MKLKFLILLLIPLTVNAKILELPWDMKLDVKGYAGYKYVGGSADTNFIPSNPELGALLNLQVNEHLNFFNQFTYGNQKDPSLDSSLVYSFAALDFNIAPDLNTTFRIGRLRHDIGLYNNIRINPRTRQGIIMPQSIYWDSLNLIFLSGDGINASLKYKGLELNYTMDSPLVLNKFGEAQLWAPRVLNSINTSFRSHQLVSASYEFDTFPIRIKADWATLNLGSDYTSFYKSIMPTSSDVVVELANLGIEYKTSEFTISAETLLFKSPQGKWDKFDTLSKGYSYTGTYAFNDNLTGRINYNEYNSQSGTRNGFSEYFPYARDLNIGLTWREDNWQIGAEIHKIQGGRWVNSQDFINKPESYENWFMFATNIVYFFD